MRCYLVRHGEAKNETEDPARPLSDHGRDQIRDVAERAAALRLELADIRHSGKLRARQTAEILAEFLLPARGVHAMEGLAPMDHPGKAQAAIEAATEPVMLVGHLPHLSRLASLLLGNPNQEIVPFPTGVIACLARIDGGYQVEWILTPEIARM